MYEKIKELCGAHNISIYKFEREIGVSNGYINKLKNHKPKYETLRKIADYFGVKTPLKRTYCIKHTDVHHLFITKEAANVNNNIERQQGGFKGICRNRRKPKTIQKASHLFWKERSR